MAAEPSVRLLGDATAQTTAQMTGRTAVELGRWLLGALLALLWLAALLVVWRRMAGALSRPLPPPALITVGVLLASAAAAARLTWRRLPGRSGRVGVFWLMALLPTAAILTFAAALSVRETALGPLAVFWTLLVAEELWAWRPAAWTGLRAGLPAWRQRVDPAQGPTPHAASIELAADVPAKAVSSDAAPPDALLRSGVPGDDVLQQLTRSLARDGSEQISGWLRAPFLPDQRTASVHVAFCPPFVATPELSVEQLDGPPARIKTAQVLPHGARLDLKLAATADEAATVLLQFSARCE